MDTLTAVSSSLAGVRPTLDENGSITKLDVDINLAYADSEENSVFGRMVSFNAWEILNDTQKTNMQDIQSALMGYIITNYFI